MVSSDFMNSKPVVILLLIVALALGAALFIRHNKAVKQEETQQTTLLQLSNQLVQAKEHLVQQEKVNTTLETNLVVRNEEAEKLSNTVVVISSNLARVEAEAKATTKAMQEEVAKRDAKITELEGQKDELAKRMTELNGSISNLESQIADTQRKLAASEGDREFLLKELKRMQAEKAELERQFNDLAVLREQVKKLKDDLSIARRLEWIRRGLYGNILKGAERLQKGFTPPVPSTNYDLNVELNRDGSVKVAPPSTNGVPPVKTPAPAINAPPAK